MLRWDYNMDVYVHAPYTPLWESTENRGIARSLGVARSGDSMPWASSGLPQFRFRCFIHKRLLWPTAVTTPSDQRHNAQCWTPKLLAGAKQIRGFDTQCSGHSVSCTGSFPGVNGRGVALAAHPQLALRLKKQ